MSKIITALLCTALAGSLAAQSVTWASDVAPILYDHCVQCHRSGGIGTFSLIGYDNAVTFQSSIQLATAEQRMPPWKADPAYRHFAGENILSAAQIQKIQDWVDAGAPAGDLSQAPPDPVFHAGSDIGIPDLALHTPVYTMTSSQDEYRCFVLPSGMSQTEFLRGMEVIPGNHQAVHHVLVYQDLTGKAKQLDSQTPEPGYVSFGGIGVQGARLIGAWVPGARQRLLPPFMGIKIDAGADIVVQVHFPAAAKGMSETSTLNLFFTATNQGIREVTLAPLLYHYSPSLQNGPLAIPANTVKTFHEQFTVPQAASLLAVAPHMHLLGKSVECYGVPLLGDTIPLIRIPDWDFHWQGNYTFQKVQKIPVGTKVHAFATYDNTSNNPDNPSSPPKDVSLGEATTDEMMLVYFLYTAYQPGDENIVLDSTLLQTGASEVFENKRLRGLQLSPNPASDALAVTYELKEMSDVQGVILDAYGRVLKIFARRQNAAPGLYRDNTRVGDLPAGTYWVRVQTGDGAVLSERLVKGK